MSQVVVRSISGDGHHSTVTLFEDEHLPATTGGVVEDILIDGVRGAPVVGYLVNVRHPDVRNVTIRNIDISDNAAPRAIAFSRAGTVQRATIDGVTSSVPYTGSVVHVGGGTTVQSLQLSNVAVQSGAGLGAVVQVSGTIDTLQGANINQSGGRAVVNIDGAGKCPKMAIAGLASTATLGVFVNNASAAVECHLSGVTVLPTARLVAVNAGSVFLRGHGIVSGESHITISSGATSASIRATGMDVRVDASTLTPQPGDAVFNTNASLKAGVGPATWSGTEWKAVGALAPSQIVRSWDVPNIEPGMSADLTTSMGPGTAAVGDFARAVPPPDFPAGLIWSAFVSAADTVTVRVANMTASAINPAPGTWKVAVNKT